jgi:hypothetical protein
MVAVLFVDNSANKIEQVKDYCPGVDSIHVPGSGKAHKTTFRRGMGLVRKAGEQATRRGGITASTIRKILSWSQAHRDQERFILFDWGRTITNVAGVRLSSGGYSEQILKYLCGEARLKALRSMFAALKADGAHVGLLTNNTKCADADFQELVKNVVGHRVFFICSKDNKGSALKRLGRGFCLTRKQKGRGGYGGQHAPQQRSHS